MCVGVCVLWTFTRDPSPERAVRRGVEFENLVASKIQCDDVAGMVNLMSRAV